MRWSGYQSEAKMPALFSAVQNVSDAFTLTAFIVAVLAFAYRTKLSNDVSRQRQRANLIKSVPEGERLPLVMRELENKKKWLARSFIPWSIGLFLISGVVSTISRTELLSQAPTQSGSLPASTDINPVPNVDFWEEDLPGQQGHVRDLAECQRRCRENSACKAYTFGPSDYTHKDLYPGKTFPWCWPKGSLGSRRDNTGMISGIMIGR
jgi:hypothetical protein